MNLNEVTVLCAAKHSNYKKLVGLNIYDEKRNAYNYDGVDENFVIAHPPCAQWSRMKGFANRDKNSKALANFCFDHIEFNGGIFEHPAGSSFFKYRGVKPTCEINQLWFGFPARKATWLYFVNCEALPISFVPNFATKGVNQMDKEPRSVMPLSFCVYLLDCIDKTKSK